MLIAMQGWHEVWHQVYACTIQNLVNLPGCDTVKFEAWGQHAAQSLRNGYHPAVSHVLLELLDFARNVLVNICAF